ncbi:MAG: hypothetical protein Fur0037_02170 [Planctomycetota bacterium]
MDVGEFAQENRRWLLGTAIGFLVYWIGSGVISSRFDVDGVRAQAQRKARAPQGAEGLYDGEAQRVAAEEKKMLEERLERLRGEAVFTPGEDYSLQGKAMAADDYLTKVGRDLRDRLQRAADLRDVQIVEKGLKWPAATDPDGVRDVLFGLSMLDQVADRLFRSHDEARAADPLAQGLQSIQALSVDPKGQRASAWRPKREKEIDVGDYVEEERVSFQFQSDAPTAYLFLEKCREMGRALLLDDLTMVQGTKQGDPLTVKGTVRGLAFKEPKK